MIRILCERERELLQALVNHVEQNPHHLEDEDMLAIVFQARRVLNEG